MADDYETCMNELAYELATHAPGLSDEEPIHAPGLPAEKWNIVIQPAKRRKKKRRMLYQA